MTRVGGLLLVWLAASRALTPGLVLGGLVVAVAAAALVPPVRAPRLRWWRLGRLLVDEAAGIGRATLQVARVVLSRGTPAPAVLDVHLPGGGGREAAWVAALLTITPGTYVVDLGERGDWIRLHLLDGRLSDDVAADARRLHRDVVAVTGGPEPDAVVALATTPTIPRTEELR